MGTQPPPQPRAKSPTPKLSDFGPEGTDLPPGTPHSAPRSRQPKGGRPRHRAHLHPAATRIEVIMEEAERIHDLVASIPTGYIRNRRGGAQRLDPPTIDRNQITEALELAGSHLGRAFRIARKLR
jgi:hypothetical protein